MDNAIDELIAECGEILANPDSYNLESEAKRIESALETVVPKVRMGLKMFRATIGGQSSYGKKDAAEDIRRLQAKAKLYADDRRMSYEIEKMKSSTARTNVSVEQHADSNATSSSSSTSSSSLRASVDNLMETIAADQGLTSEDKDMLAACLAQMELAAKRGDQASLADRMIKGLEIAKKGGELVAGILSIGGKIAGFL